ncbi:potassium channel protein [Methanococcoides methylutens]|uniref:Potassium channel protein n=1 Tax=Methanococcoides methylutens TaxID=2226 RepID=A0A099T3Z2_METMT|nr:potassium channel protein [Methanococcoides methylutens]KGK98913.1 potassium channel protein [Methanococcoides methylutens]
MRYPKFLSSSIAAYIAMSIFVVLLYMVLFINLMEYEGQHEYANLANSIYWVMASVTTVGYGDIVFHSMIGKIFSIIVMLSGIPLFFGILITLVITPWFEKTMKLPLAVKVPKKYSDHIIVCGYNALVETLVEEFQEQNTSFVIVSEDEDALRMLSRNNIPCMYGDPSDEVTLENANINSARFLIANQSDNENANIVLTARKVSDVKVIAVAEDASKIKYLKYAGADRVISPKLVLGRFFAKKAVDPFLGVLFGTTEFFDGCSIVEFPVYSKSELIGKTLAQSTINEKTGATVIGLRKGGQLTFNIHPGDVIKDNTVILAVGSKEQLQKLGKLTD